MVPSMNWLACHLHYIHNITYNTGASLSARTVRMEPRRRDRMPALGVLPRWPHDTAGATDRSRAQPRLLARWHIRRTRRARGPRRPRRRDERGQSKAISATNQWKRPEASSAKWGGTKGVSLSMEKARGFLSTMGRHEGRRVEACAVPRHEDVLHPGPLSWGDE